MDDTTVVLKRQLLFLLRGGNAHMPIKRVIKNFPVEFINETILNFNHSAWHILEHLRLSQNDIINFIQDSDYQSPDWSQAFWPELNKKADESEWQSTLEIFFEGLDLIERIIKDKADDLLTPIAHQPNYTVFREVLVLADHNSYHIGQLLMLQKILTK